MVDEAAALLSPDEAAAEEAAAEEPAAEDASVDEAAEESVEVFAALVADALVADVADDASVNECCQDPTSLLGNVQCAVCIIHLWLCYPLFLTKRLSLELL